MDTNQARFPPHQTRAGAGYPRQNGGVMDRIVEISRIVERAGIEAQKDSVNWATAHCLLIEELKEALGLNNRNRYMLSFVDGNPVVTEVIHEIA